MRWPVGSGLRGNYTPVRGGAHEADPHLAAKLTAERAGILNWLIEGCLAWQAEGLADVPEACHAATDAYRTEMDVLSAWAVVCATFGGGRADAQALTASVVAYSEQTGRRADVPHFS